MASHEVRCPAARNSTNTFLGCGHKEEVPDPGLHTVLLIQSFHFIYRPCRFVCARPCPYRARLTGFLVIASTVLMAPASVRVTIGATRINELIGLFSRPFPSDGVRSNLSPRVRRACQVANFTLVIQASNNVRFEEVSTCARSDGLYFKKHAVNACCRLAVLLPSLPLVSFASDHGRYSFDPRFCRDWILM